MNQYFIHARMSENWGYERLWHKLREESNILVGEEGHANWIEAQLALIAQVGEGNYLARQMKKE